MVSYSISVNANCLASFTATPDSAVKGYYFTNTSTPGTFTNVQWNFGDNTTSTATAPYHMYAANGNYMVSLTIYNSNGSCQSITYDTLAVTGFTSGCQAHYTYSVQGAVVSFYNSSSGVGSSTLYYWNFGDGTSGMGYNITHTYASSGPHSACLTIIDSLAGCTNQYCYTVYTTNTTTCNAHFTAVDTAGYKMFLPTMTGNNLNYYWTLGDGSTSTYQNPWHQYNAPGFYHVCLTITDSSQGCTATWCDSIYFSGTTGSVCTASFAGNFQGALGTFTMQYPNQGHFTYWTFGDGSTSILTNPTHTYTASGNYTVCLTVSDSTTGCYNQVCHTYSVTVGNPNCYAGFQAVDTAGAVQFFPTPVSSSLYYHWSFGDGTTSTQMYPLHQYALPGTYHVCLYVIDSTQMCSASYCDSVVFPATGCNASFNWSVTTGTTIHFVNNSTSTAGSNIAFTWSFGDGSSSTASNPTHTYANAGTYTVCLSMTTSGGCTNSICHTVTITNATCSAQFLFYTDSTGVTHFSPTNANSGSTYSWSYGDGTTGTGAYPSHIYGTSGSYVVCLNVVNQSIGCYAYNCDTVIVSVNNTPCNAAFTAWPDSTTNNVYFNNSSTGGFTYQYWSFGDGTSSSSSNPIHLYATSGTYLVCLTVYNNSGCQSSFCDSVVVGGNPNGNACVPTFYSYPDSTAGSGTVYFNIINPCSGTQYVWSVNGTAIATGTSPVYTFPDSGWYYVCVTGMSANGTYTTCDSVYAFRLANATGLNENPQVLALSVAPNPATDYIQLSMTMSKSAEVTISIMSLEGRALATQTATLHTGAQQLSLDVNELSSGMYLLRLSSGDQQSITRFVVQR
jgi:PKD repeat protein